MVIRRANCWLIILFAFNLAICGRAHSDILEDLRAKDKAVLEHCTFEAVVVWRMTKTSPDSEIVKENVIVTRKADTLAYKAEMDPGTNLPKYPAVYDRRNANMSAFAEAAGHAIISRRPRTIQFWDSNTAGTRYSLKSYEISPQDGIVGEGEIEDVVLRYKPSDPLQHYQLYQIVLATGRGFAAYIDRVVSETPLEDGQTRILAAGRFPAESVVRCQWNIALDNETHLVRRAVAQGIGEFETSGILADGVIALKGCYRGLGEEMRTLVYVGDGTTRIVYTSYASSSDEPLILEAKENFAGNYPTGTHIVDYRLQRPVAFTVKEGGTSETVEQGTQPQK
ncbi:MAG: hypothetical protein SGI88_09965 [Candidatus Hydrogenedentes bacterium]|nr:hypothetical protein [Candidatus Hydrogenedentota bacterium]